MSGVLAINNQLTNGRDVDSKAPSGIQLVTFLKQPTCSELINIAAKRFCLSARDIELQLLLHLPRLDHYPTEEELADQIQFVSQILGSRINGFSKWLQPPIPVTGLEQARFDIIQEPQALIIHEHFHYLGSPRSHSLHFGLQLNDKDCERIIALVSLSEFDLMNIAHFLPNGLCPEEVLVLSRGFAFDWSPPNKMSYLLGKTTKWLKANCPEIKMLITYVNPNLGFTGAAYKASNWVFFGREFDTRYTYLDGQYITDRRLTSQYGIANADILRKVMHLNIDTSRMQLKPLNLYAYFIDTKYRALFSKGFNYDVRRP